MNWRLIMSSLHVMQAIHTGMQRNVLIAPLQDNLQM